MRNSDWSSDVGSSDLCDKRQQDGLSEIAREIIDTEGASRGIPITVGDKEGGPGVLNARSNAGHDEADTEPRQPQWQSHNPKAGCRDSCGEDQRCAWRPAAKESVGG